MLRSMMQMYVKGSVEAVEFYREAFGAELMCAYPDGHGGYMHSELNAFGQILAVSEIEEEADTGSTMQFCFHFGEGGEKHVRKAYEVLKEGAFFCTSPAPCDFSSCQFCVVDKFGVSWCLFV